MKTASQLSSSTQITTSVLYGLLNGIIVVPVMISFCSIIFRHPFYAGVLPYLVKLVLFSSAVHQISFTIFSSLPFAVGQVQDAGLIFLTSMAGNIVQYGLKSGKLDQIIPTTLIILSVCTSFLGVMLIVVSKLKLASLVQYLPMPVIGGYLAFIGFFCGEAGLTMMAGTENLYSLRSVMLFLPGLLFGISTYITIRIVKSPYVLPFCMVMILVLFYGTLWITGTSLESARHLGWIAQWYPSEPYYNAWILFNFSKVEWSLLPRQCFRWLGMFLVVAFSSSLDVAAIEMELGLPLDYNKELETVGIANLISGLTGGYTGSYIFSQTIFNLRRSVSSRICGATIAILEIVVVLLPFPITAMIPKMFFGSLLVFISVDLMYEWLYAAKEKMTIMEFAVCIMTFISIHNFGIEIGMLIGILLAITTFVITYARLQNISVASLRSSTTIRTFEERAVLMANRGKVITISLTGYIFFGSAVKILEEVKRHVIIGIDSNGDFAISGNQNQSAVSSPHPVDVTLSTNPPTSPSHNYLTGLYTLCIDGWINLSNYCASLLDTSMYQNHERFSSRRSFRRRTNSSPSSVEERQHLISSNNTLSSSSFSSATTIPTMPLSKATSRIGNNYYNSMTELSIHDVTPTPHPVVDETTFQEIIMPLLKTLDTPSLELIPDNSLPIQSKLDARRGFAGFKAMSPAGVGSYHEPDMIISASCPNPEFSRIQSIYSMTGEDIRVHHERWRAAREEFSGTQPSSVSYTLPRSLSIERHLDEKRSDIRVADMENGSISSSSQKYFPKSILRDSSSRTSPGLLSISFNSRLDPIAEANIPKESDGNVTITANATTANATATPIVIEPICSNRPSQLVLSPQPIRRLGALRSELNGKIQSESSGLDSVKYEVSSPGDPTLNQPIKTLRSQSEDYSLYMQGTNHARYPSRKSSSLLEEVWKNQIPMDKIRRRTSFRDELYHDSMNSNGIAGRPEPNTGFEGTSWLGINKPPTFRSMSELTSYPATDVQSNPTVLDRNKFHRSDRFQSTEMNAVDGSNTNHSKLSRAYNYNVSHHNTTTALSSKPGNNFASSPMDSNSIKIREHIHHPVKDSVMNGINGVQYRKESQCINHPLVENHRQEDLEALRQDPKPNGGLLPTNLHQKNEAIRLEMNIFHGSSDPQSSGIDEKDNKKPMFTEYLVLDFRNVLGVDATAARSCFLMLVQLMYAARVVVVFANMSHSVEQLLRAHGVIRKDAEERNPPQQVVIELYDEALEWCEEQVLQSAEQAAAQLRVDFISSFSNDSNDLPMRNNISLNGLNQPTIHSNGLKKSEDSSAFQAIRTIPTRQLSGVCSPLMTPGLERDPSYYSNAWKSRHEQSLNGLTTTTTRSNDIKSNAIQQKRSPSMENLVLGHSAVDARDQHPMSDSIPLYVLSNGSSTFHMPNHFELIDNHISLNKSSNSARSLRRILEDYLEVEPRISSPIHNLLRSELLTKYFIRVDYNSHEVVFDFGQRADEVYFIEKGAVEIFMKEDPQQLFYNDSQQRSSSSNNSGSNNRNSSSSSSFSNNGMVLNQKGKGVMKRLNKVSIGGLFGDADFFLGRLHSLRAQCLSETTLWKLDRIHYSAMELCDPDLCLLIQHALLKSLSMSTACQRFTIHMEDTMDSSLNT